MSGRQQRVMVQPIVRNHLLFHSTRISYYHAECYLQKSTAGASPWMDGIITHSDMF
jgi:hypothetical protein